MATGSGALQFGQFWLIHELTGSPLYLGYVGLASAIPAISLNVLGGVIADKVDRRRLLVATSFLNAALIFVLATLTLLDVVRVWHVLVIILIAGAVRAFDVPARNSIYPYLMDRAGMTSGFAIDSGAWWSSRIFGPAAAGGLISIAGTSSAFYLSGVCMLTSGIVMSAIKLRAVSLPATGSTARRMLEGVRYIGQNPTVSFLLGMGFYFSIFGASYFVLMPVFAVDVLGVGAGGQGVLLSAAAIGALVGAYWIGSMSSFQRRGLVIIVGGAMAGFSLSAFGLTSQHIGSYPLAIGLMFSIGCFMSVHTMTNATSLQLLIPDAMRGRVMGIQSISYSLPTLGSMPLGLVANVLSAPAAVAMAGIAVASFSLGPALLSRRIRHLGALVRQADLAYANPSDHQARP